MQREMELAQNCCSMFYIVAFLVQQCLEPEWTFGFIRTKSIFIALMFLSLCMHWSLGGTDGRRNLEYLLRLGTNERVLCGAEIY